MRLVFNSPTCEYKRIKNTKCEKIIILGFGDKMQLWRAWSTPSSHINTVQGFRGNYWEKIISGSYNPIPPVLPYEENYKVGCCAQ